MISLTVNGVNMIPYLASKDGLKWSRNDVDGSNAGRTQDGTMYRDRVATKIRLDCSCRPLTAAELSTVLNTIQPVYVSVTYDDPLLGRRTAQFYSNNVPAAFLLEQPNGTAYWGGVSFPLIER